jgi:uncharacterized OB-fold protein
MTADDGLQDLTLTLIWRHGYGSLAPFLDALKQGRILGAHCPTCGWTTVPPRTRCPIDGSEQHPVELPPTGIVMQVTTGAASGLLGSGPEDQTFAMVRITGSHNGLLVRIDAVAGLPVSGNPVKLAVPSRSAGHAVQRLVFSLDAQGTARAMS